jgi:lipopolysaccharide/colanic/teichoic acid biosynthesis glycosyltransferase
VRAFKRGLDIAAALVALTLGAPIVLGTALAVRRSSPGPVIYRQKRMRPGPDGVAVEFEMLKFRSMYIDAEARSGPQLATDGDPRITSIGHALRKHRLDELPQFINILRGEMSLVGPRPERRHFADQLEAMVPGFTDRHMVVKPGLTGWAQVQSGYGDGTERAARAKASHDMAYIAHCYRLDTFVRMELKIIWMTVRVVLTGHGAK